MGSSLLVERTADSDLKLQIRRERITAQRLSPLCDRGWTMLHDRFLPGTEHRVAHVLIGPAGLVIVTGLPVSASSELMMNALRSGSFDAWFATRGWESDQLDTALRQRLGHWPWTGPVYVVALLHTSVGTWPTMRADVPIINPDDVVRWISDLPHRWGVPP